MLKFKAVIFDMDGVLINSEPLWKIAEKEVFSSLGVKVTDELVHITSALTAQEVCAFWYKRYPWQGKTFDQVEDDVVARVIELIGEHDTKMPGVKDILDFCKSKGLKIGLASNSSHNLIEVVLEKVGIKHYFDFISSAQDVEKGKPNPAVYLFAAKNLGVTPDECIVFEDSIIGIAAAKSAGMTVVAVPAEEDFEKTDFELADYKIKSFEDSEIYSIVKILLTKEV
jgi:mannitol-1-/sugar-/sorbitol-6-/2-deoxyglucose-6-phosphatase